jgi:hypothetical protein
VELASAILVIGSCIDIVISVTDMSAAATAEERALTGLSVAVGCGLVALGLLIRRGRAWLLSLNVVAVAAFFELQAVTMGGIFAAVLDMAVVGILLRERWWFQWIPPAHREQRDAAVPPRPRA